MRVVSLAWFTLFLLVCPTVLRAAPDSPTLQQQLQDLDTRAIVLGKVRTQPLASMLSRDVAARLRAANRADSLAWEAVKTRADWERFRDSRMQALRVSLGTFPPAPHE